MFNWPLWHCVNWHHPLIADMSRQTTTNIEGSNPRRVKQHDGGCKCVFHIPGQGEGMGHEDVYSSSPLKLTAKMLQQVKSHLSIKCRASQCDSLSEGYIILPPCILSNSHESGSTWNTPSSVHTRSIFISPCDGYCICNELWDSK